MKRQKLTFKKYCETGKLRLHPAVSVRFTWFLYYGNPAHQWAPNQWLSNDWASNQWSTAL